MLRPDLSECFGYDKDDKTVVMDEYDAYGNLTWIASIGLQLAHEKYKPICSVVYRDNHPRRLNISPLGEELIKCIIRSSINYSETVKLFHNHKLSPIIKIIFEKIAEKEKAYQTQDISFIEKTSWIRCTTPDQYQSVSDEYNSFAEEIRTAIVSSDMKERLKSFRRNANDRYQKFILGCRSALERHSKCLPIRLDTASRHLKLPRTHLSEMTEQMWHEQCQEIERDRNNFIKHLHRTFGKDLIFYAWKIEYGRRRGLHIHWFLILNGNKHQDRINIPMRLGEHWEKTITQNQGRYRNINHDHSERTCILKTIHHSKENYYWEHFERIARYLTKVDCCIKIALPGNMRSFGCSKYKHNTKAKPGPKRMISTTASQTPNLAIGGISHESHVSATA